MEVLKNIISFVFDKNFRAIYKPNSGIKISALELNKLVLTLLAVARLTLTVFGSFILIEVLTIMPFCH